MNDANKEIEIEATNSDVFSSLKKKQAQAARLVSNLDSQISGILSPLLDIQMNATTKGTNVESVLVKTLSTYMGSRFNIHGKAQVIDSDMHYLDLFETGGNEFDIILTFKTSTPDMIVNYDTVNYIPYDSVAAVIEVKTILEANKLEDDLVKLQKLDELQVNPQRFKINIGSQYKADKAFKILFYLKKSIDNTRMKKLLERYIHAWDFIVIIQDKKVSLLINSLLPFIKTSIGLAQSLGKFDINQKYIELINSKFIIFLSILSASIPEPLYVDLSPFYLRLWLVSQLNLGHS